MVVLPANCGTTESVGLSNTQAYSLYLEGRSYVEIAGILKRPTKTIDNALQRVKHKLEKQMDGQ
jgi:RNA polymerase sporulation-specific sigma factor